MPLVPRKRGGKALEANDTSNHKGSDVPKGAMRKSEEDLGLKGDYLNVALLLLLYTLQGVPMGLSRTLDLILQEKSVSFEKQGVFGMISFPYSIKLLWAPVVDSVYIASVGRRKSWLIPVQFLIALLLLSCSFNVEYLLGEDTGEEPHIWKLTCIFFAFYFLCATQDIAVDGWAVTMLARRNVGYASTCNAIGQTFGYFVAFTGFLGLKMYGIMDLAQFMRLWGYLFLLTTVALWLFKTEAPHLNVSPSEERRENASPEEAELSVKETYKWMINIVRLPSVRLLAAMLLTRTFSFAGAENLAQRKLVQKGMKKEQVASLMVFITPVSIILPGILSKYITERPLTLFKKAHVPRLVLAFLANFLVFFAPNLSAEEENLPQTFYMALVGYVLVGTILMTVQFVSQMAFYAQVADPRIGGTYMTLLNTISNLGSILPYQVVLFVVNQVTIETCNDSGSCEVWLDGFYIVNMACVFWGIAWYLYFAKKLDWLQNLKHDKWHIK